MLAAEEDEAKGVAVKDFQAVSAPSSDRYPSTNVGALYDFLLDRLRSYYADQNVPSSHFDAVADLRPASLLDFDHRLKAIGEFAKLPEADALPAANKRIRNILKNAARA